MLFLNTRPTTKAIGIDQYLPFHANEFIVTIFQVEVLKIMTNVTTH